MNQIIVPIITVHRICQRIASYLNKDVVIDLLNAYISQYHLDIAKIDSNDDRYDWEVLCDTINDFPDANKLDFIGQILDAGYITIEDDFNFINEFVMKYNYIEVQEKLFEQLAAFTSDAVTAQEIFAERLKINHPESLKCWKNSIEMLKGRYYSEAGNDIRKSFEFLLCDILCNKKSLENQIKAPKHDFMRSEVGKYLKEKGINKQNVSFIVHLTSAVLYISNEKFKHGEPTGLTESDIRFYMNETFLIMQRFLDIEEENLPLLKK